MAQLLMDDSVGLIILLAVLVGCSAFFSATETAFSSLNNIRIKNLASGGNKRAELVSKLSLNYDKLLTTILIGNNIVNILSASIATVLFVGWCGDAGVTISTAVMTVLVLIFGEISPKSIAKDHAEGFAMAVARPIRFLEIILTPVNFLFVQWKKLLNKLFGAADNRGITEEELMTIVDEAEIGGEIDADESDLIKSAIEFNDLKASDILTPRIDVRAFEIGTPTEDIIEMFLDSGFSRLPVYRDTIDSIIGVVHQKDLFHMIQRGGEINIMHIVSPVKYISQSMEISELIRVLQKTKTHFAVVTDEYGGTEGILTLEDILEELVGEIWDEHDEVIENVITVSDNRYIVLGSADLEELFEIFGEDTDEDDPNTVSGWVMEQLEKMPEKGDSFDYGGFRITVCSMEARRVAEILLDRITEAADNESESENNGDKQ